VTTLQPVETPVIDLESKDRFINRELSWLAFNLRVIEEAFNPRHPLLERLRFLSISASNLDEFYMVRVAGLKGQVDAGVVTTSQDGLTPAQQLVAINREASELLAAQKRCWSELKTELREAGIAVVEADELTKADLKWLETRFMEHIFPVLTPLAIDPAHPFPFIPNAGIALVLHLFRRDDGEVLRALVPLPQQIERFIRLPGEAIRFVPLETLVLQFLDRLFPGFGMEGHGMFRVIRDSEMDIDEEAEDLVRVFESALKRRRRGHVIRLTFNAGIPEELKHLVIAEMHVAESDVYEFESSPSVCATSAATASPPSARRTSWSITRSKASTWWCSSFVRRRATPTWSPSSRPFIAPPRTAPSSRRWWRRPRPASRSPPWWN